MRRGQLGGFSGASGHGRHLARRRARPMATRVLRSGAGPVPEWPSGVLEPNVSGEKCCQVVSQCGMSGHEALAVEGPPRLLGLEESTHHRVEPAAMFGHLAGLVD